MQTLTLIISVSDIQSDGTIHCALQDGRNTRATPEMYAEFRPVAGDYWCSDETLKQKET